MKKAGFSRIVDWSKARINWLRVAVVLAVALIAGRLFFIQVVEYDKWSEAATAAHTAQNTLLAKRGEIYLLDGSTPTVAVLNQTVWTVIVDPMTADPEETAAAITEIAGNYVTADFDDVFADRTRRYYVVAKKVDRMTLANLKERALSGVWYQETTERVYPEGTLAATTLGFVNADGIGQYGVEGALNERLAGTNGLLKTVVDVNNVALSIGEDNVEVPAVDGENIVLTLDRNVQAATEQALSEVMEEYAAEHGAALVMNPQTGEILAMATNPTYDPGNYAYVSDASVYINQVTEVAYEPASVCKTLAFAAAINEGKMTPETTYNNTDEVIVDGWTIGNASTGHTGTITMQTALNWSLNTGSVQALRLLGGSETEITTLGKELLYEYYYERFRIGQATGIELYEATGLIYQPDSVEGTAARYANMTFGQGVMVTMLQLAAAYTSIINGGEYYEPTLVAGTVDEAGNFVEEELAEAASRTISAETSATMRQMLHEARNLYIGVEEYDAGYFIGAKTGTAQTVDAMTGAYTSDETVATYIGFGAESAEDLPEYLIVVKMWSEGQTLGGGGATKAVFDKISLFMLDYLRMEPKA